ncbi:MAG: enolase C-terminal domain-like protein, partial [Alphaproteobacteria bacterium]
HAGRRVDVQDFLIVCPGAESFAEALDWTAEVYRAAGGIMAESGQLMGVADEGGFWPAFQRNEEALDALALAIERAGFRAPDQVAVALDIASSEFGRSGRYRLALEDRELSSAEMATLIEGWRRRYPIVSVEDPLAEDDWDGMADLTSRIGADTQIVGDDFLVTDAARVARAAEAGACNAVLLKPNQRGTLTETLAAWEAAKAVGFGAIVSARSGETEDVTIIHLAVGWGVPQFKVGSFTRSERMAKWNEALRIEEALGAAATFAGASALGR